MPHPLATPFHECFKWVSAQGESLIFPQQLVVVVERVTYMALIPRCSLVTKDVVGSAEHHHIREVVAEAQEPGVSRTDPPIPSFIEIQLTNENRS